MNLFTCTDNDIGLFPSFFSKLMGYIKKLTPISYAIGRSDNANSCSGTLQIMLEI